MNDHLIGNLRILENKHNDKVYCESAQAAQAFVVRCPRTGSTYAQVQQVLDQRLLETIVAAGVAIRSAQVTHIKVFGEIVSPNDGVHDALFDDVTAEVVIELKQQCCQLL